VIRTLVAWGPAAIWAAVLFLLSEVPPDLVGSGFGINDKVVHLGLYSVLGGALAWGVWKSGRWVTPVLLLVLGFAYGALDEWHQSFVPGRDPSVGDFLADCAGVLLGFFFLRSILKARARGLPDDTT
jgi:VanZ family protein